MTSNKSPDLEVISSPGIGEADLREKRKKPRINVTSEQFRMDPTGKVFSVVDLSLDGMSFRVLDTADLLRLPVATRITGVLNLGGTKYDVQAQVKHLGNQVIGCQFADTSDELKEALGRFLDPSVLGSELRPIPSSDTGVLWYHGPGGTDLLLSRKVDGQYHRLTLFIFGNFIQWDEDKGLSTGRATASDDLADRKMEEWGVIQFEAMVLDADREADPDKLSIAKALILSSNLPQDLKKWCVRQILPQ